jgi:hypothetical protein
LKNKVEWLKKYWFLGLVLSSILFLQILPGHRAFDDAYITYRYSQNISTGNGFTYNPGENVLGTTTPLYTLILAVLGSVISIKEIPTISLFINSVADIASVLLLFSIISELKYPKYLASITSLAYLYNPLRIGVSRGGMETALVVSLILASLYVFIVRKNYQMAAILSGVAFLARPDTLLLPLLFAGYQILLFKKVPAREVITFLIITGPWLLFSGFYFDSLLPHSIIAKSNAYLLNPLQATTTFLGYIATRSPLNNLGWPTWVVGLSLLINLWLFIIGSISIIKRSRNSLIMMLFPVFYSLGLMIANPLLFIWYFPPFLVLFNSLIIIGLHVLLSKTRSYVPVAVSVLFVGLLLCIEWKALDQPKDGLSVNLRDHESLYEIAADSLQEEISAGSTIAMPEIGVLGYSFPESRIIDTVGIITPEAIKYQYSSLQRGQIFSYAIPTNLILDLQPDYLLSLDIFLLPSLLTSEVFLNQYSVIAVIPTNAMGSSGFYVFRHTQNDVE